MFIFFDIIEKLLININIFMPEETNEDVAVEETEVVSEDTPVNADPADANSCDSCQ